jgi:hypothetical protein
VPEASVAAHFDIDADGYVSRDGTRIDDIEAAARLCAGSAAAQLFAVARLQLRRLVPQIPVYADAWQATQARSAGGTDGQSAGAKGPYICVQASREAFWRATLAERAGGSTAAWSIDGAVRPSQGETSGAPGFACCRHDGTVVRRSMPNYVPLSPGSTAERTCTSYDVELEAQVVAADCEMPKNFSVIFDATSPVDAALSFASAHNRHRASFHCDEQLATLTS